MVDFIEFFGGIKGEKTHDFANRVRIVGLLRVEIDAYPTSTNPKKTLVNMMIPKTNPLFI